MAGVRRTIAQNAKPCYDFAAMTTERIVSALQRILKMVEKKKLTVVGLEAIASGRIPFGDVNEIQPVREDEALGILGRGKVVLSIDAVRVWKRKDAVLNSIVPYGRQTIQECASTNQQNFTNWHLMYICGLSLKGQHELISKDPGRLPKFLSSNNWWLDRHQNVWTEKQPASGYYLVDFNGRFGHVPWRQQEDKIARLGENYCRAEEAMVSEAAFSHYYIHKKNLLEGWWHWGNSADAWDGRRVRIGDLSFRGLKIDRSNPNFYEAGSSRRVCILRKWDIAMKRS